MNESAPLYKRILLKLSGEALMGERLFGIEPAVLKTLAMEIAAAHQQGVQVAVVVGGGNIFRGLQSTAYGVGRVTADQMGMLATVINSLALSEVLQSLGADSRVMTAIKMTEVAEPYVQRRAVRHLEKGRVVLLGAGTGNPYFTTDTAAALRAVEVGAEVLLKATDVDAVYEADPKQDPSAKPFSRLGYSEVLNRGLGVMDLTAISLSMSQQLPIIVFNLKKKGNILNVVMGEKTGTLISGDTS